MHAYLTCRATAGEDGSVVVHRLAMDEKAVTFGVQEPLDVRRHLVTPSSTHATSTTQEVTLKQGESE
jgi:hypothetical protein